MTIDRLINLLAVIALVQLMITIGLGATLADIRGVVADWRGALRAVIANYMFVPAAAVGLLFVFHPQPIVATGVIIVAVCPGAPFGPPFTSLAKGDVRQAVGLMVILAGSSALLAPLLLQFLLPLVATTGTGTLSSGRILSTLAVAQFLPLCGGLVVATYRPSLARALLNPFTRLGGLLNVAVLIVILIAQFRLLSAVSLRGYVGMLLLVVAAAAAGWVLGGRTLRARKTLAITTAVRNVGVGLVIAGGNFPGTPAVTLVTAFAFVQTVFAALAAVTLGRHASREDVAVVGQVSTDVRNTPPSGSAPPAPLLPARETTGTIQP